MASVPGASIPWGFNRPEHHDKLVAIYEAIIPKAADAGLPNVICFSGNREGLDDEAGIENCAAGLKRLVALAEREEGQRGHGTAEQQGRPQGLPVRPHGLGRRVVQAGRLRTVQAALRHLPHADHGRRPDRHHREGRPYIAHYHTGGVPGRDEIDETQEIYYPAVMRAIVDTGYQGFIAQEFIPRRPDPLKSLREAVAICDV